MKSIRIARTLSLLFLFPGTARAQAPASPTRLVVMITIDQMRPDYFTRFDKQLTGGLGRLYRGGAVFTNAHQDHANTETAPGHSTILSGREPRSTGIVHNSLGVQDPQAPLMGRGGIGASPFRFRGTALLDWLRMRDPRSRALSISRKDRGAIFPMGRAKAAVFWYSGSRFTTSTYYGDSLPTWLNAFNDRKLPEQTAGRVWDLLLPDSAYSEPDSVRYEYGGRNFLFPHKMASTPDSAARLIIDWPWMDEITLQAALAGLEAMKLGTDSFPDILAVSLSTTDAVGHRYGPLSREQHDHILRLDRWLGQFIDSLYKIRDSSKIVFALTADHGVTPFPEMQTPPAQWVEVGTITSRYNTALRARGVLPGSFDMVEGTLLVDRVAFANAKVNVDSVIRAYRAEVLKVPGVLRADVVSAVLAADTVRDERMRLWRRAFPLDMGIELVITLKPGSVWGRPGATAPHGAGGVNDTHVPIIFYGPPFTTGRFAARAHTVDIAPTLARILNVAPLEKLDGRVLAAALARRQ